MTSTRRFRHLHQYTAKLLGLLLIAGLIKKAVPAWSGALSAPGWEALDVERRAASPG